MRHAAACAAAILLAAGTAHAQVGLLDKEARVASSPQWTGERFADGRPKVSDDLIDRLRLVSLEEAWGVLRRHGYHHQFEGNWGTPG